MQKKKNTIFNKNLLIYAILSNHLANQSYECGHDIKDFFSTH